MHKKHGRRETAVKQGGLLCEMLVVEDVVLAEAMVSGAAGAVPELQVGVVRVGPAAHLALVAVAPLRLLFLLLADGGLELDGLVAGLVPGPAPAVADLVGDGGPEEHEEVQQGHHGGQGAQDVQPQQAPQHAQGEEHAVGDGQPFHLDRDDEHDEEPGLRVQHGKGEEQGQIDVIRAGHVGAAVDQAENDAGEDGERHAGEVIEVELGRAPFPFQGTANHVVKIQKQHQPDNTVLGDIARHEDERHQPPQLAAFDGGPVKGEEVDGAVPGEYGQQVDDGVAGHDPQHEVGDAEPGMLPGEAVHRGVQFFQR